MIQQYDVPGVEDLHAANIKGQGVKAIHSDFAEYHWRPSLAVFNTVAPEANVRYQNFSAKAEVDPTVKVVSWAPSVFIDPRYDLDWENTTSPREFKRWQDLYPNAVFCIPTGNYAGKGNDQYGHRKGTHHLPSP